MPTKIYECSVVDTTCSHKSHADADLCVECGPVDWSKQHPNSNALPTTFVLVYVRFVSLSRIRRSMGAYLEKKNIIH